MQKNCDENASDLQDGQPVDMHISSQENELVIGDLENVNNLASLLTDLGREATSNRSSTPSDVGSSKANPESDSDGDKVGDGEEADMNEDEENSVSIVEMG